MMKRMIQFLAVILILTAVVPAFAEDNMNGIWKSSEQLPRYATIFEDGMIVLYSPADQLPNNPIGMGFIESIHYIEDEGLMLACSNDQLEICFPDHSLISFVRTEGHPFFPTGEEILEAKRVWSAETLGNIEFQSATEVLVGDETGTYNWGRIKTSTHVYFIQRSVYSADDALDSGGNAYAWTLNDQTWQIFESSDREGIGRYLAVTSGEPFNLDESSMKHED